MDHFCPRLTTDHALFVAARRYREARQRADDMAASRMELTGLLTRFGAPVGSSASAVEADDARLLDPADSATVRARAEAQRRSMLRFARSNDPRYDINRHIAVDRLLRWFDGRLAWIEPRPQPRTPRFCRPYQRRA